MWRNKKNTSELSSAIRHEFSVDHGFVNYIFGKMIKLQKWTMIDYSLQYLEKKNIYRGCKTKLVILLLICVSKCLCYFFSATWRRQVIDFKALSCCHYMHLLLISCICCDSKTLPINVVHWSTSLCIVI